MTKKQKRETFTVIYAAGGRDNADWSRLSWTGSRGAAEAKAAEIVRGGRPAYVRSLLDLERGGLPEGPAPDWDYKRLAWG